MRGGVKDNGGSGDVKDLTDTSTVADVGDDDVGAVEECLTVELELQRMKV